MIDVVATELEVVAHGLFDLERIERIDAAGVARGWCVWCHCCGDYIAQWLPSDVDARAAAGAHVHTVDPVTALARMRHDIPGLLGDEEVA